MQVDNQIRIRFMHADPVVSAEIRAILASSCSLDLLIDDASPTSPVSEPNSVIVIADFCNGIDLQRAVMHDPKYDGIRILIITQHDKEWDIRYAVECGVPGYLLQSAVPAELAEAVTALSSGGRYLCGRKKTKSPADEGWAFTTEAA